VKRLGNTIPGGGFKPHVSPAQIQSVDDATLDDSSYVLKLYLWSAQNNPDFATIQAQVATATGH